MSMTYSSLIQRITILGSTGSIGVNTLDVIARHPNRFEVFALTGATQVDLMLQQCLQFKPSMVVMAHADAATLQLALKHSPIANHQMASKCLTSQRN